MLRLDLDELLGEEWEVDDSDDEEEGICLGGERGVEKRVSRFGVP